MSSQFDNPVTFADTVTFSKAPSMPASSVGSAQGNTSDPFDTTHVKHLHFVRHVQKHGTAIVAHREQVHKCYAAETLVSVKAQLEVANSAGATVTIDVQKASPGGSPASVLTSTFQLTDATAVFTAVSGSIATSAFAANDVAIVIVTVSGTTGQGLLVELAFKGTSGGL